MSPFHVKQTDTSPFESVLPAEYLFHVEPERALDGFRWARLFHVKQRVAGRTISGEDLIVGGSTFGGSFRRFTCYLRDFWSRMGVPRKTKCIVLSFTNTADLPLLTHIY